MSLGFKRLIPKATSGHDYVSDIGLPSSHSVLLHHIFNAMVSLISLWDIYEVFFPRVFPIKIL